MSVNAPEPGSVKDYLVNEEDTVTVGQDLLKLELGGPPRGGEKQKGGQEPKAPAQDEQSTSSDPEPKKDESKSDQDASEPPTPSPRKEPERKKDESKSSPPPDKDPSPADNQSKPHGPKKPEPKATGGETPYGSREERRVCT